VGGSLCPLLAWSLLTDSNAAWLSLRMHRVDADDFMRFICFAFSVLEFALVCLFHSNDNSRRLPSLHFDGEFGHSSRALSQNNQQ
jgi:hypothetical protein